MWKTISVNHKYRVYYKDEPSKVKEQFHQVLSEVLSMKVRLILVHVVMSEEYYEFLFRTEEDKLPV